MSLPGRGEGRYAIMGPIASKQRDRMTEPEELARPYLISISPLDHKGYRCRFMVRGRGRDLIHPPSEKTSALHRLVDRAEGSARQGGLEGRYSLGSARLRPPNAISIDLLLVKLRGTADAERTWPP